MITAELANGYNRDVMAFPGRANDLKSAGCNKLIRQNKAMLIQETSDLLDLMNWNNQRGLVKPAQQELFQQLDPDEELVIMTLKAEGPLPIDRLYLKTGMTAGRTAAAILNLELKNLLLSLPGKVYRLN